MKITTPEDKKADLSELDAAVLEFEILLKAENNGQDYYHLVITRELNKEVCRAIGGLYRKAGWRIAQCKTSSEGGERPGLTGLQLTR